MPECASDDRIEAETRKKYGGEQYKAESICHSARPGSREFFDVLLRVKTGLVESYSRQAVVLDVCCGSGEHLMALASIVRYGAGLDFSRSFIARALELRQMNKAMNIAFLEGNARRMPFSSESFDLVYCFSALYHIPAVAEVVGEIVRVTRAKGKCILEFGNTLSLNTLVCRAHPETAQPCHLHVGEMKHLLATAGLTIHEHRAFQILPLWGRKPRCLRPLLWTGWTRLLAKQIKGRMLDEWLCRVPGLRNIAFRHLFVCSKE